MIGKFYSKVSGFYGKVDRKFLQESHWIVQENVIKSYTGKSMDCTGKWTGKLYRKVSGLYRKLDQKVVQEINWFVQESDNSSLSL